TVFCVPFSYAIVYSHHLRLLFFFSFNHTAPAIIYTLSLHDALPIYGEYIRSACPIHKGDNPTAFVVNEEFLWACHTNSECGVGRSEEHTSELQSRFDLVCRLLLEKKKTE